MSICPFCHPYLDPSQRIVADNDTCYFLMHDHEQDLLVDFGVIVPKQHRATTFKLTPKEWSDTYTLLHDTKSSLEKTYDSDSYTRLERRYSVQSERSLCSLTHHPTLRERTTKAYVTSLGEVTGMTRQLIV